jgi:5-methylcytosine-specific restriction enzyme subunit McrC
LRPISLEEYRRERVRLSPDERDALRRLTDTITIAPLWEEPDTYDLTPGSTIGAINLGDLAIQIRPKISLDRVLFLLSYALDPRKWDSIGFDFAQDDSLFEAVIPGFVRQLHRALDRGALSGYRLEETLANSVRGSIRFSEQIKRRFGLFPPADIAYDKFTEDIEENRLLKAALERLARMPIRSAAVRQALRTFDKTLVEVSVPHYDPRHVPEIRFTRLNRHYEPAIKLATLILRSLAFELHHGQVRATGFLVDMNKVFENFVVVALREELGLSEYAFPQEAKGHYLVLDEAERVPLKPDISWWDGSQCTFVGDAKYKCLGSLGVNHPDLYQLLAYSVAGDLPGGLLIYAAGEGEPAAHRVARLRKTLDVIHLDLSGDPGLILGKIRQIGERIRRLRADALAGRTAA